MKLGSIFSGGGGFDIGAKMAGFTPTWAIEYIPYIAACYARNIGDHVIVGDLLDVLPQSLEYVDLFHASPPCPNFSNAKQGAKETPLDRCFAHWISHYIRVKRPLYFTLENVQAYRKSQSWQIIQRALVDEGYGFDWWVLNSADYGVPQTRKRMIVIGRRDGRKPQRPQPTHEKEPRGFFALKKWVGWYEAIEDLLPTLPTAYHRKGQSCEYDPSFVEGVEEHSLGFYECGNCGHEVGYKELGYKEATCEKCKSDDIGFYEWFVVPAIKAAGVECRDSDYCRGHFAKWQEKRLPEEVRESALHSTDTFRGLQSTDTPSNTVTSSHLPTKYRALLFDPGNTQSNSKEKFKRADAPSRTIVGGDGAARAWLIPGGNASNDTVLDENDPSNTVGNVGRVGNAPRALVVGGDLCDNGQYVTVRDGSEPINTLITSHNNKDRTAHTGYRIVKMTIQAMARFQSFPDWYAWPEKAGQAQRINGNAVPPLLAYAVCKSLKE